MFPKNNHKNKTTLILLYTKLFLDVKQYCKYFVFQNCDVGRHVELCGNENVEFLGIIQFPLVITNRSSSLFTFICRTHYYTVLLIRDFPPQYLKTTTDTERRQSTTATTNLSDPAMEWAKCGESTVSVIPTLVWALGASALAHRLVAALFRRFLFRRVPLWELVLQNLLFIWMVIYSLHFWVVLVKVIKIFIEYCYDDDQFPLSEEEVEGRKLMQQWVVWMCGMAPMAVYVHTRPRPQPPPLMIWITTSPWQRREMGPYGYYLNRPLSSLHSTSTLANRTQAARRAFSDSKILIKEQPKKKRYSKSV